LDATTRTRDTADVVAAAVAVNGPKGEPVEWGAVDWRRVEQDVRRLRQRIFAASQAGDLKQVRNLQKLMLRSRSNALASVRKVTQLNAGRKTAGVDGEVVVAAEHKADMAAWLQHRAEAWSPRPVLLVMQSRPAVDLYFELHRWWS
jgi:RNA-directed DNA polymerase